LEHGTRDVRLGQSQTERKRERPWRCDSAQPRRKRGRGEERGVSRLGAPREGRRWGPGRARHVARLRESPGASIPPEQRERVAVGRRGRQGSGGKGGWQVGQLGGWGPADGWDRLGVGPAGFK
jgi:hypothetical protein